jgi:hypothetical protein
MADTFSQIYIQIIFAVQGRHNLISHRFKEEYLKLLKRFNIEFKDEYLFEWID